MSNESNLKKQTNLQNEKEFDFCKEINKLIKEQDEREKSLNLKEESLKHLEEDLRLREHQVQGQKSENTKTLMNLNYRERLLFIRMKKVRRKSEMNLNDRKLIFKLKSMRSRSKKNSKKKRLQKKSECEIAKLRQEEEVIFEAKIEAEKASSAGGI